MSRCTKAVLQVQGVSQPSVPISQSGVRYRAPWRRVPLTPPKDRGQG